MPAVRKSYFNFCSEHCEKLKDLSEDKSSLYEMLYDVLIRGHDEEKEAFDRFFFVLEVAKNSFRFSEHSVH